MKFHNLVFLESGMVFVFENKKPCFLQFLSVESPNPTPLQANKKEHFLFLNTPFPATQNPLHQLCQRFSLILGAAKLTLIGVGVKKLFFYNPVVSNMWLSFHLIYTGDFIIAAGAYVVEKNSQLVSANQMPFQL